MSKQDADSIESFHKKCRAGRLKVTPQRSAIYASLLGDKEHPSADVVFRRLRKTLPSISFDTVNRTLLTFVDLGILKMVEGYGRPKRFDPDTDQHHHFQCLKCNKIVDFYNQTLDAIQVPKGLMSRFTITGKKVVLEGICKACNK